MNRPYSKHLAQYTDQITEVLYTKTTIREQEKAIYSLLEGLSDDYEIIIQKTYIGGLEKITNVDISPKTINLFQDFREKSDRHFLAVGRLFLGFLYCERFKDSRFLYDALQEYQLVTGYPTTESLDVDEMLLEAGLLLEPVISQTLVRYAVDEEKSNLQKLMQHIKNLWL